MRKIIYHIASSIDGFIARKNGSVEDFLLEGDHALEFQKHLKKYDIVIMGGKTYEFGFQFGIKPGQPAYEGLEHIIVSKSLHFEDSDQVKLVSQNAINYIRDIKNNSGKDIWLCGGGNLAGQLANEGLIDELLVKVNPVIIGNGIRLFHHLKTAFNLKTIHSKKYENNVMLNHYKIHY